jgi:hypothetical protein
VDYLTRDALKGTGVRDGIFGPALSGAVKDGAQPLPVTASRHIGSSPVVLALEAPRERCAPPANVPHWSATSHRTERVGIMCQSAPRVVKFANVTSHPSPQVSGFTREKSDS